MRRFTWVPFALALLAFTLPFATVSCEGPTVEPSGADLVLRTPPETEGEADIGALVVSYAGGLATAAFLAFTLALLAAARGWGAAWTVFAGSAGVTALLVLKWRGAGAGEGLVTVDVRAGGFLAVGAGVVGVVAAGAAWLRNARPSAPAVGAVLIVAGYLLPGESSDLLTSSYADSLNVREPWTSLFSLLPVAVGVVVVARRDRLDSELSTVALAVFGTVGAVAAHDVWRIWRDGGVDAEAGVLVLLAGMAVSAGWTVRARRGRAARQAAAPPAPARARAQGSPPGPSARESAGNPPAAP